MGMEKIITSQYRMKKKRSNNIYDENNEEVDLNHLWWRYDSELPGLCPLLPVENLGVALRPFIHVFVCYIHIITRRSIINIE